MLSFSSIIKNTQNCSSEALNCCLKKTNLKSKLSPIIGIIIIFRPFHRNLRSVSIKKWTADCGLGIKQGLGTNSGLETNS